MRWAEVATKQGPANASKKKKKSDRPLTPEPEADGSALSRGCRQTENGYCFLKKKTPMGPGSVSPKPHRNAPSRGYHQAEAQHFRLGKLTSGAGQESLEGQRKTGDFGIWHEADQLLPALQFEGLLSFGAR